MIVKSRPHILLLHPPVVKPSEPPAGVARLAGALHCHGVSCTVVDLNLEALLNLMHGPVSGADRWTRRALRNLPENLNRIRTLDFYERNDRYQRSVMDLNRVFEQSSPSAAVHLSLVNYQHRELSPVRSSDLLRAAEVPEENPFFPYFQKRLLPLLADENPTLAGISLNYLSQALTAFALLGLLRRAFPGLTLVLGGGLVTSWLRKPDWQNPFGGLADHLVAGAGESALLDIVGIHGVEPRHMVPNYGFTPLALSPPTPHSPYLAPGFILPYSTARGCYWNRCAFCPEQAEGNPYLPIPVEQVIGELQGLVATSAPVLLHLLDNALRPQLLEAFLSNPPGAPWYGFARITGHFADAEFCRALKRSGCTMLQVGIESGDQQVLDNERKGIELAVVSQALRNLKRAGIATYVYLLFGTPSETLQTARKTLVFTVRHAAEISFLNLAVFNLPLHASEARGLQTRMHYAGDLSLYVDFDHPKGWHRLQVRQFLAKEFKRHPAIAPIIRRDPPFFTSNHAPFFPLLAAQSAGLHRMGGLAQSSQEP